MIHLHGAYPRFAGGAPQSKRVACAVENCVRASRACWPRGVRAPRRWPPTGTAASAARLQSYMQSHSNTLKQDGNIHLHIENNIDNDNDDIN